MLVSGIGRGQSIPRDQAPNLPDDVFDTGDTRLLAGGTSQPLQGTNNQVRLFLSLLYWPPAWLTLFEGDTQESETFTWHTFVHKKM